MQSLLTYTLSSKGTPSFSADVFPDFLLPSLCSYHHLEESRSTCSGPRRIRSSMSAPGTSVILPTSTLTLSRSSFLLSSTVPSVLSGKFAMIMFCFPLSFPSLPHTPQPSSFRLPLLFAHLYSSGCILFLCSPFLQPYPEIA